MDKEVKKQGVCMRVCVCVHACVLGLLWPGFCCREEERCVPKSGGPPAWPGFVCL